MSDPLTIIHGDALSSLRILESESVQCVVTSPPYWGLRDYGHEWQIGLEKTPEEYVDRLVEIFLEIKRVLRYDGTLWLNLGDSYATGGGAVGRCPGGGDQGERFLRAGMINTQPNRMPLPGLKSKDLIGVPWRVAFALQADGWYLRSDIIWSKPNPMPESVTDRPTKSHEYIFLLSKSERYYYDAEAIAEPNKQIQRPSFDGKRDTLPKGSYQGIDRCGNGRGGRNAFRGQGQTRPDGNGQANRDGRDMKDIGTGLMRNKRTVWTVTTQPFSGAHFATFPPDLIKPCILAGSRPSGKRCDCDEIIETPLGAGDGDGDPTMHVGRAGFNRPRKDGEGTRPITRREQRAYAEQIKQSSHRAEMATEASTAFEHYIRTDKSGARPLPPALLSEWLSRGWLTTPEPCACPIGDADTVLDPFAGSGTTGKVAIELGRKAILIEPKAEYVEMIKRRCQTTIGLPLSS